MNKVSNQDADQAIRNLEEFRGSNFYGVRGSTSPRASERWQLYGEALRQFCEDQDAGRIVYSVWSYATPIAWYSSEGWRVPSEKHSHTTSRHQYIVRRAVAAGV